MIKIQRNSKGFTLIELLIVVAIIGILAAVAIPAYTGYTKKSKIAGVVHAMGGIKTSIAAYFTETNTVVAGSSSDGSLKATYGIDVPEQYATYAVAANTGVITATIIAGKVGADCDGKTIILTPDATFKTWTWSGSLDVAYRPKNT